MTGPRPLPTRVFKFERLFIYAGNNDCPSLTLVMVRCKDEECRCYNDMTSPGLSRGAGEPGYEMTGCLWTELTRWFFAGQ